MQRPELKFAFFGSSRFSSFVLEELEAAGYSPLLNVTSAREPLPEISRDLDLCVVASFGKILPKKYLGIPKNGFLNIHPSLLPEWRGPSPIQNLILQDGKPGVTIIKMDEEMDHGPILAQEAVELEPWPDHYAIVEEKLARAGGRLLIRVLENPTETAPQDHSRATFTKIIRKEDGLLDLSQAPETNLRKVLAYSVWPGAYMLFSAKGGSANPGGGKRREIRVIIKDAKVRGGKFEPTKVIPAGKREMNWQDFLRGN